MFNFIIMFNKSKLFKYFRIAALLICILLISKLVTREAIFTISSAQLIGLFALGIALNTYFKTMILGEVVTDLLHNTTEQLVELLKTSFREEYSEDQDLEFFTSNTLEEAKKNAAHFRSQAEREDNDIKAQSLANKAKREQNLVDFLESDILQRVAERFENLEWDANNFALRIANFKDNKVAIFYPKADKINFNGGWIDNGRATLEKALNQ